LTDEQWERIAALLPPQKPSTGRPAKDHRTIVEAILWIDRTGAPWRDLPQEFGPWQSVATRFYRWVEAGVWDQVLAELQKTGGCLWGLRLGAPSRRRNYGKSTPARGRGAKRGSSQHSAAAGPQDSQQEIEAVWGEAGEVFRPRSTSGPKAQGSPSPS
jgi:transposase